MQIWKVKFGHKVKFLFLVLGQDSEDVYSKLVEVVTVAHVDDEKRVDNSLVQIWKVKFGQVFGQTSTRFQGLVKILKLMFRQDFEAEVWSLFCC